jgi:hypothetical protein
MKKYIALAILLMFFVRPAIGQAPTCPPLASIPIGAGFVYQSFDGKHRLLNTNRYSVVSNRIESGYQTMYMDEEILDSRGRLLVKGEHIIRCQDNVLFYDMTKMVPAEALVGAETSEVRTDRNLLRIPIQLELQQVLPEATVSMEVGPEASGNLMTIDFTISNRTVAGMDSLQTAAGVFYTTRIEQKTTTRSKVLMMRKTLELQEKVWYDLSKGILIRKEDYDKKAKMTGYTILTQMN